MTFDKLYEKIYTNIIPIIENKKGLNQFASERAKFEGWLKSEIIDILYNNNPIPEKDYIDVVFDDWALELKTTNTSYKYENVIDKTKPISDNVKKIINDIKSLKKNHKYKNSAVLFIVFPLELPNKNWEKHLNKIKLEKLKHEEFSFQNGIKGILYFGLVKTDKE